MSIGGAFRALGRVFDHWEGQHWTISRVGASDGTSITDDGVGTVVELEAPIHAALGGSGRPAPTESVCIERDGTLEIALRLPLVPDDVRPAGLHVEATEVRTTAENTLVVGLVVSMPSSSDSATDPVAAIGDPAASSSGRVDQPGAESHEVQVRYTADERPDSRHESAEPDHGRIERHRPDVPAFEDTAYLREVYETFDTFAEMADELDMDVTAETVRRYMIDAGVHEPTRYNTGSTPAESDASTAGDRPREETDGTEPAAEPETGGDADGTPVLVTDGIGLPEGLSVDEFVDIVKNSRTLYEVQRAMGVEREAARDLLEEYNLLDFVMGQLACESDLYVTREEVVARIRDGLA